MKRLETGAARLAQEYFVSNARVLERRRYDYLYGGGGQTAAAAVVAALDGYRNADGGYGHALEPDGRGPGSQPVTMMTAAGILDELGLLGGERAAGIGDYLQSVTADDGGLPFVHPNARDFPRAPWWQIPDVYEGSLITTASMLGLLLRNKVEHPWLGPAAEFCWSRIDALAGTHPYEARAMVRFLDNTPERERAAAAAARIGKLVRDAGFVQIEGVRTSTPDGYGEGELPVPTDYAAEPESLARQWFSDAEIDDSLDGVLAAQKADGSWPVPWAIWTPITAFEWGGVLTLEALHTLHAYGRA